VVTLPFLLTALVVVLMPGTGVLYTVSCGLISGRRAAVVAAFGCTLGIVPHIAASLVGLAAVLHAGAAAYQALRIAGAVYLAWLAWCLWRDAEAPLPALAAERPVGRRIVHAIAINLLNPKLTVFFFAFLPQFVDPAAGEATRQMAMLGAVFMAMTFAVFVVYGCAAAAARRRVLESPRLMAWLKRGFAGVFALLGARLAFGDR